MWSVFYLRVKIGKDQIEFDGPFRIPELNSKFEADQEAIRITAQSKSFTTMIKVVNVEDDANQAFEDAKVYFDKLKKQMVENNAMQIKASKRKKNKK